MGEGLGGQAASQPACHRERPRPISGGGDGGGRGGSTSGVTAASWWSAGALIGWGRLSLCQEEGGVEGAAGEG